MVETIAAKRPLMYVRDGSQKSLFFFQKQFAWDFIGTRTSKSDLLQKITKMVVECSCVVDAATQGFEGALKKYQNDGLAS